MPDKKCDHIVGLLHFGIEAAWYLLESDDDRTKREVERFKYCPLCAEQINDDHDFK